MIRGALWITKPYVLLSLVLLLSPPRDKAAQSFCPNLQASHDKEGSWDLGPDALHLLEVPSWFPWWFGGGILDSPEKILT